MKLRTKTQIAASIAIILICLSYGLYIREIVDYRIFSIGDMNPYGGWSALKSFFTDLSYRWRGFTRSIALTTSIALTAILMGRFFCGYICPIGSLQDFSKYIGKKIGLKEIKLSHKPELFKYFVLILIMVFSILGLGNIISPLSPWLAYLNIFIGLKLQIGTIVLIIIVLASLFVRRIFCRYFCPLGAFQSLLYAIGPLKINKVNCNCNNCLKDCPVSEEERNGDTVTPECINCLNCIESCFKDRGGYFLTFGNKVIKKSTYIILSICLVSLYLFLPLTTNNSSVLVFASLKDINDGQYSGFAYGFGGIINTEVKIENKRITGIIVLNHGETPGYYEEVFREFTYQIIESQNLNLDAISGATSTGRGFLNSVKDAVNKSL